MDNLVFHYCPNCKIVKTKEQFIENACPKCYLSLHSVYLTPNEFVDLIENQKARDILANSERK